jgi:hypothetical protein
MLTAVELDVKSTGNSQRNTTEIVFAGMGFVAIGGNFARAKIRVLTPQGRGVGIRRPLVGFIENKGCSLLVVKHKGTKRPEKIRLGGGRRLKI